MSESITSQNDPNADENLLFGMLALQMDFINNDQLVAALKEWNQDRSTRLDVILQRQHALTAQQSDVIHRLKVRNLELHGGSVEKSLETVRIATLGNRADELSTDRQFEKTIHVLDDPSLQKPAMESDSRPSTPPRFQPVKAHARGGLGEVFVALDKELNRFVALKEIQTEHAGDGESRSRFEQEAEITGGLEHPGIVPVYGKGTYSDGRPYYAMRFIEGFSLRDAIAAFHEGKGEVDPTLRSNATESEASEESEEKIDRVLGLHKLLSRFVDVCNAIHYAHNRGVIHRDIKPANIMLGRFGETLVVDWGLAKAIGKSETVSEESNEKTLRPTSGSGSAPTQLGQAVGTPGYMSPEQAAGLHNQLEPASDIYGLGATLYSILTGKPPFQGKDITQLLHRVQQGDFAPPRKVNPKLSKPLEAICLKAMSTKIRYRYDSARDLAEDIERWMADEPVSCYRAELTNQVRRFARRHSVAVASMVAAIVVAICALVGFSVTLGFKNQQLLEKNRIIQTSENKLIDANDELEKSIAAVTDLNDQLEGKNKELEEATRDAEEKKMLAEDAKSEALARQQEAEEARYEFEYLGDFMVNLFSGTDPIGISELSPFIHSKAPQDLKARDLLKEGEVRLSKLDATPLTKARIMTAIGSSYRTLGDLESAGRLFDQALEIREAELPEDDLAIAESLYMIGWLRHDEGEYFVAEELYRKSLAIREKHLEEPNLLIASTLFQMGWLLSDMYQFEEAKTCFKRCLRMRQELLGPNDRAVGIAWAGIAANKLHANEEDLELFQALIQAVRIFDSLVGSEQAGQAVMKYQSAVLATRLRQYEKAESLYRESIEITSAFLSPDHPWVALGHFDLAMLFRRQDRIQEAHEELTEVMRLCDSGLPEFHPKRAIAAYNHAEVASELGKHDIAAKYFRNAADILENRLIYQPDDADANDAYLDCISVWADELIELDRIEEAETALIEHVDRTKKIYSDSDELVDSLQDQANLYIRVEQYHKAAESLDEADEVLERLRAQAPEDTGLLSEDAYTQYRLAVSHSRLKNYGNSVRAIEDSLESYLQLMELFPKNTYYKQQTIELELALPSHLLEVGRIADAKVAIAKHWDRIGSDYQAQAEKLAAIEKRTEEETESLALLHEQLAISSSRRALVAKAGEEIDEAKTWYEKSLGHWNTANGYRESERATDGITNVESKLAELEKDVESDDSEAESDSDK